MLLWPYERRQPLQLPVTLSLSQCRCLFLLAFRSSEHGDNSRRLQQAAQDLRHMEAEYLHLQQKVRTGTRDLSYRTSYPEHRTSPSYIKGSTNIDSARHKRSTASDGNKYKNSGGEESADATEHSAAVINARERWLGGWGGDEGKDHLRHDQNISLGQTTAVSPNKRFQPYTWPTNTPDMRRW